MAFPYVPHTAIYGEAPLGTQYVCLSPRRPNPDLPPVVSVHGWSMDRGPEDILPEALDLVHPDSGPAVFALLASGRSYYYPYTGACWGTSITDPELGGTGVNAITDMVTQSELDGNTSGTVDIWGTSMGGNTAMVWAMNNAGLWNKMFLASPALDLIGAYDVSDYIQSLDPEFPSLAESLRTIHGGSDRASWIVASEMYDPNRNRGLFELVADRITVFAARDDSVVSWATIVDFLDDIGAAPPIASNAEGQAGGDHWFNMQMPGWDDLIPLQAFS